MWPQPVDLLKLLLNLFCMIDIHRRELYLHDFIDYSYNTSLHLDAFDLISFKLGMMLGMTTLSFDSTLNDFDLH